MPPHLADAAQPGRWAQFADTIKQAIDEEASDQFNEDFDEGFRQHGRIMALLGGLVKRGRIGCDQALAGP
jgi:hypothetical protein